MVVSLRVTFDGKAFVPAEAVDLAAGRVINIQFDPTEDKSVVAKSGLQALAEAALSFGDVDLPPDMSTQLDHYLYGTPKRENP